ncbi:ABC transporter substrate-binding protein [Paraclostridium sordellii]|uniref:ABC transporter substrate-binding protein n=1 Tax=Paraclostridium sordellii TaxID=1505 RepID=UPI0030D52B12
MHLKKKVSTLASIFIVGLAFNVGCSSNGKSGSNVEASSDEVMGNLNAREAIAMAVDKDNFVDVILNNGSTSANYFVPKNLALDENQKDFRDRVKDVGILMMIKKQKKSGIKLKKK